MTTKAIVLPPAGYEYGDARRPYVERYGSTLVMNTYLKIALLCVSLVAVGLLGLAFRMERAVEHVRPLVIRIDDVGRASAIAEATLSYTPQAPELKYFLVQFVTAHYSRMRATVRQQYAESLYFLDGRLADATIDANKKAGTIERFLTGSSDEIEVHVTISANRRIAPPSRSTRSTWRPRRGPSSNARRSWPMSCLSSRTRSTTPAFRSTPWA
jgi:type IV secretory pathway TrbF-like protein